MCLAKGRRNLDLMIKSRLLEKPYGDEIIEKPYGDAIIELVTSCSIFPLGNQVVE